MKIAIYPGSFDPITLGHLDIIRRAALCFDKVFVCVMDNCDKKSHMFPAEKRLEMLVSAGETLVVVTADHETGGLTLVDGDLKEGKIVCKFSTGGHSGVMVPVYAFGPGAQEFTGIYENTAIFDKIKKLLNL